MQEREREKELELIKKQYLGTEKVKKKIRKPSEKFHLNFDWETTDDTSKDLNPIYNQTHEAALLFGSGKRAGVDVQEQKKIAAEHHRQLLRKMREAQVCTEASMLLLCMAASHAMDCNEVLIVIYRGFWIIQRVKRQ